MTPLRRREVSARACFFFATFVPFAEITRRDPPTQRIGRHPQARTRVHTHVLVVADEIVLFERVALALQLVEEKHPGQDYLSRYGVCMEPTPKKTSKNSGSGSE